MHGQAQPHDVRVEVTELQGGRVRGQRGKVHAEEVHGELAVDVVELVTPLAVFLFQVFRVDLAEVVQVERALRVDALVDPEGLAVLLSDQGVPTVGALQGERLPGIGTVDKSFPADLAQVLASPAGVVVDVLVRGAADRTDGRFRDRPAIPALDRLDGLPVPPLVVLEQELPVLFLEGDDERRPVNRELLVLRGVAVVKCPLFERDISADKVQ